VGPRTGLDVLEAIIVRHVLKQMELCENVSGFIWLLVLFIDCSEGADVQYLRVP